MNLFKKYKSRLVAEGVIKSVLCGIALGLGVNFITALISWLCGFEAGLWLAIGLGVVSAAVSGVIFYFVKFIPSEADVARRVDALGLEERMVTLLELKDSDSYIARRQREDAAIHAASVGSSLIKFKISGVMIATASCAVVCGVAMTTLHGLTVGGFVPSFEQLVNPSEEQFIEVSYVVKEGGFIDGDENQLVSPGEDPTPVMAMPDDGWMFVGWDDGLEDPYRQDPDLVSDYIVTAVFEKIEGEGENVGNEPGSESSETGGEPGDKPGDPGLVDGEGGDPQPGDPGPGHGKGPGGDITKLPSESVGQGPGSGGKFEQENQAIDGKTYYGDVFQEYYEQGMAYVTSDKDLTDQEREAIEKYMYGLK